MERINHIESYFFEKAKPIKNISGNTSEKKKRYKPTMLEM